MTNTSTLMLDKLMMSSIWTRYQSETGRKGNKKGNRRPARKAISDMKFLMSFIKNKVVEKSALESDITLEAVDRMYVAVVDCLCGLHFRKY